MLCAVLSELRNSLKLHSRALKSATYWSL